MRYLKICLAALLAVAALGLPSLASAQGPVVTREFLVGRWTDTNDCSDTVDLNADGSFVTTQGARGRWTLQNGMISFIGTQTVTARVRATSNNAITLAHPDGRIGASTRCSVRRLTMPPLPASAQAALGMGSRIDRAYLIGSWTDTGDCGQVITFYADGRFVVPTGAGRWTLVGDQLSFIGQSTVVTRVRGIGRDRVVLVHTNGQVGQSLRCD